MCVDKPMGSHKVLPLSEIVRVLNQEKKYAEAAKLYHETKICP
jgi:hypothetical protein